MTPLRWITLTSYRKDQLLQLTTSRECSLWPSVSPRAFIWIHAQSEKNRDLHARAAKRGCWVEFDGINSRSVQSHLDQVKHLADAGFANQTLISMDAGWYHVGEPGGGNYRGYDSLFTEFLPELRKSFSEAQVNQLIVANPRQALALRVRKTG